MLLHLGCRIPFHRVPFRTPPEYCCLITHLSYSSLFVLVSHLLFRQLFAFPGLRMTIYLLFVRFWLVHREHALAHTYSIVFFMSFYTFLEENAGKKLIASNNLSYDCVLFRFKLCINELTRSTWQEKYVIMGGKENESQHFFASSLTLILHWFRVKMMRLLG